tara:strand:+ start:1473 stop:1592 length:120 start_codon:yes stop_codon:yes gene_type:complete
MPGGVSILKNLVLNEKGKLPPRDARVLVAVVTIERHRWA